MHTPYNQGLRTQHTCFRIAWDTLGKVFFSRDLPTDFLGLLPFLDDCFGIGARQTDPHRVFTIGLLMHKDILGEGTSRHRRNSKPIMENPRWRSRGSVRAHRGSRMCVCEGGKEKSFCGTDGLALPEGLNTKLNYIGGGTS